MQDRVESARVDFVTKSAKYACQTTRTCLKGMWQEVKDVESWQHFFRTMHSDVAVGPTTPQKKKKRPAEPVCIDLRTPPEKPKSKTTKHVAAAKAVPLTQQPPRSPTLKVPGQKDMEKLLEPGVPDLDGLAQAHKQKVAEDSLPKVPPASFDARQKACSEGASQAASQAASEAASQAGAEGGFEEEMEEGSDGGLKNPFGKNRRTRHVRECKKRTKTKKTLELEAVKGCLARHGMTYASFQAFHIRKATVKKAASCQIEGWQPFCRALHVKKMPECPICLEFLRVHNLEMKEIESVLAGVGFEVAVPPPPMPPPAEEAEETEEVNFEACVKYVKERDPHIDLIVEGVPGKTAILRYRCRLCRTKTQPEGKVNLLGKPVMKRIRYLLERHIVCDSHVGKRADLDGDKPGPDDVEGGDVIQVDCEGCLSFDEQDFHDRVCIVSIC